MELVEIIATQLNRQIKFDLNSFVEKKTLLINLPIWSVGCCIYRNQKLCTELCISIKKAQCQNEDT